jgi:hypothetical protein
VRAGNRAGAADGGTGGIADAIGVRADIGAIGDVAFGVIADGGGGGGRAGNAWHCRIDTDDPVQRVIRKALGQGLQVVASVLQIAQLLIKIAAVSSPPL